MSSSQSGEFRGRAPAGMLASTPIRQVICSSQTRQLIFHHVVVAATLCGSTTLNWARTHAYSAIFVSAVSSHLYCEKCTKSRHIISCGRSHKRYTHHPCQRSCCLVASTVVLFEPESDPGFTFACFSLCMMFSQNQHGSNRLPVSVMVLVQKNPTPSLVHMSRASA